ncbi:hypothetical protein KHQ81_01345 [Mycoplasmatota bacterium]|nr:hypothetical protein KHQ81_01345 [Mycoplasmatota bacterium]
MVVALIGVFLLVIIIDISGLMKTNQRLKTMIVYFTLLTLGFIISLLQVIDKKPVSPSIIIEKIVKYFIAR